MRHTTIIIPFPNLAPPSPRDRAVVAEFLAGAREAAVAAPDGVELFAERGHQGRLVGEEAVLEVAASVGLRAQSGARQVGAAEVGLGAVHDDALEVDARAEDALHLAPEARIAVEVLPEVGAGLLGVDEADLDAASDEHVEDAQEGHHHPSRPHIDIHVLDVRRAYPEALLGMRDEAADDLVVDFAVGDELVHDDLPAANFLDTSTPGMNMDEKHWRRRMAFLSVTDVLSLRLFHAKFSSAKMRCILRANSLSVRGCAPTDASRPSGRVLQRESSPASLATR